MNLDYPKYNARRYGIVVKNNPHNLPVIDPSAFVLGRAYLTHRDSLKRMVENVYDRLAADAGHPYHFIAEEYTKDGLFESIQKGANSRHGSRKIITLSGAEVVESANATRRVLSANVHPHARQREKKGVHIDEYITTARESPALAPGQLFTEITSSSDDYKFTYEKPSFDAWERKDERRYHLVDAGAAALLNFAATRPENVRNLEEVLRRERGSGVWLPFNAYAPGSTVFTPNETGETILVETLFDYYVRGKSKKEKDAGRTPMNLPEISKRLFGVDFLYDNRTIRLVASGSARFQVIQDEMIMESDSEVDQKIKDWYWGVRGGGMRGFLKSHFTPDGLVYIKKGMPNEAIAESYKNKDGEFFRIIFGNYPPLVMRLWPSDGSEATILQEEWNTMQKVKLPQAKTAHPYSELYQIKRVYDDSTRKIMWASIQLPQQADIPQAMLEDMLAVAEQNGLSRKELVQRMIRHDKKLKKDSRGYMCTNQQMTRNVQGRF
ncbi:hypothetical protein JW707_02640 [Candidatus Woesearchaeota archaeon]|nr:hypothetical protein [Candidatus Woesearchaeota archaeon]